MALKTKEGDVFPREGRGAPAGCNAAVNVGSVQMGCAWIKS